MNNPDGSKTSQKDLLKFSLDHLANAASFAFEMEDDVGRLYAIIIDNAIKIGTTMYYEKEFLRIASDYNEMEEEIYRERQAKNRLKIVKDT